MNGLSSSTSIASSPTLSINGKLRVNNSVVITPTSQPTNAVAGQVYYDKTTNQLGYYNGSGFTYLGGNQTSVTSLGGASGILTVGSGLNQSNNQLTNSGVLSLQGQTGNVTLVSGSGILVTGTQFTNTGVLAIGGQVGSISLGNGLNITSGALNNSGVVSVTSGSPNLIVSNDGNGNVTISSNGAGTGTVSSPGGAAGQIAEFTGVQTIANSLLNQSGTTITDSGSLNVTGNLSLGSPLSTAYGGTGAASPTGARTNIGAAASGNNSDLTSLSGLTTALSVLQGGTGATTFTANGILLGNGTSPISSLAAGSSGLCLISTSGTPTWQSCPGGGGVTNLNGLTGTLSIANATPSGSTITINNASTSQLGLAEFSPTDFSVSSGIVSTIQPIDTSAAPTFGQLSLTSAQSSSAMAVINNTNVSTTGNLIALQLNGNNEFTVGPGGNVVANGTIASGAVNGQTVSNAASFTGSLAIAGTTNLNGGANVTGVLGVNTITPSSNLTVGSIGQSFTLQGSSSSTITATGGGFTTNIGFTGSSTGTVTYDFDRSAVAGTYTICTTTGNCAGVGGGVTSSGGTAGNIPVFTGGNTITNSSLSDNGTTVATSEVLDVQGSTAIVGVPNVRTGTFQLAYGGANFSASVTPGGLTANRAYTLPDASGTVCLSTGNCLGGGGGGANSSLSNLSSVAINTSLLPGTTTIDLGSSSTPFRNLFLAGSSASPATNNFSITGAPTAARTLTIPDASGTICLATSAACGFATGSGSAVLQNGNSFGATANIGTSDSNGLDLLTNGSARVTIDASGNTTFNNNVTLGGSTLSSTGTLAITPGGALTVGATGQTFTIQGNSSSTITATSGINTTSLAFVTPTASVTYRLQAASAGTYDLCTTAGNCVGLGGSVTASGATTGTIAAFTGSNAISNSLLSEGGSTVSVNGNLNLTSGNVFEINGSQISSADLSDSSNLAKLNAAQTFTGATNTFSGNVAVNGGDISSSGTLSVTPGGSLTVGATGQAFTLQGNSTSIITGTNGLNTTTLSFQAPTANVTYNLPAASAGSYNICTTAGNCTGVGGGVTTAGGTSGTIPVFTSGSGIGNSLLSQSGSTVTANGDFNLISGNNYEINGSQISSTNLSDSANLAKLNAAQIFTAANTIQTSSSTAFVVQNTSGYNSFNVDSTTGNTTLGNITSVSGHGIAGSLTLADGTSDNFGATLNTTTLTANQIVTLPNASGTICLSSGNCLGGSSGGANTSLSNLSNVAINSSLLPGNASIDLGSTGSAFRNLFLAGSSASPATNNFSITGTATSARTITLPDASGTICLQSSANCGFIQLQGSTPGSAQTGNFNISGTGIASSYLGSLLDTAAAGSLTIGNTNASSISIGNTTSNIATTIYGTALIKPTSGHDSTTTFQIQSAGGANLLTADTQNGRITVGNIGTTSDQLYVGGLIPTTPTGTYGSTIPLGGRMSIVGNYLYSTESNGAKLDTFDVSNPTSPTELANSSIGVTGSNVIVQGHYAYIDGYHGPSTVAFNVVDISNPAAPVSLSTLSIPGLSQVGVMTMQGNYAYFESNDGTNDYLDIVDVSNPSSPVLTETYTLNSTNASVWDIAIRSHYLYITYNVTSGTAFQIIDISNPTSPSVVGSINTAASGSVGLYEAEVMAFNGRYLYIANQTNNAWVVDISNPASPALVGSAFTAGGTSTIRALVQGQRLYLMNSGSSTVTVFDISNPTSPSSLGSLSTPGNAMDIEIAGTYLYSSGYFVTPSLKIYNLGGTYTQNLQTGDLATGGLQVANGATVGGNVNVQGGVSAQSLNVQGASGFGGTAMFTNTVTQRNTANSTSTFQIQNAAGTSLFTADTTDSSIGIGGSGSSTSRLIVTGVDSTSSNYSLTVNNSSSSAIGQFRDDGTVTLGIGSNGFFGNDATGPADTADNYSNLMVGSQFTTSTSSLNITSVSVYINSPVQGSPNNKYQVGIYTDSGNKPSTWVAGSASTAITGNAWNTASVTTTLSANTKYWLVYTTNTSNNGNNTLDVATSTSATYAFSSAFTYGSGSNGGLPTSFPSPTTTNHMMSIYATTSNSYSPAFVVGANGNVGIGIGSSTTPTANLQVQTPTNTTTALQVQNSSGASIFNVDTVNGAASVATNSTSANTSNLLLQQAGSGDTIQEFRDANTSFYSGLNSSSSDSFNINSKPASLHLGNLGNDLTSYSTIGLDSNVTEAQATQFTASATGTLSSLSVAFGSGTGDSYSVAIYSDSSNTPSALLAKATVTGTISTPSSGSSGPYNVNWDTLTLNTPLSVTSGTKYWLAFEAPGSADQFFYTDPGAGSTYFRGSVTVGTWGATWNTTGGTNDGTANYKTAIYGQIVAGSVSNSFANSTFSISTTGNATFRNIVNSNSAFQIQNASSSAILDVDTENGFVGIGTSTPLVGLDIVNQDVSLSGDHVIHFNGATDDSWALGDWGPQSGTLITGNALVMTLDGNATEGFAIQGGPGGSLVTEITGTGQALFKNASNSTTAFQVQNTTGNSLLGIDTSDSTVNLEVSPVVQPWHLLSI